MNKRILAVLVVLVLVSLSLGVYAFLQLNNVQNNALYTKQVTIISGWVDMGFNNAWIQDNYTSNVHNVTIEYTQIFNNGTVINYFQPTFTDLEINQTKTIRINSNVQSTILEAESHNIWLGQHPHEDRGSGSGILISAFGYSTP